MIVMVLLLLLLVVIVVVVSVMTMMATVAAMVTVKIVTSGSRIMVRGRGSLIGTRALPRLLHYRVVQTVLG